MEIFKAILKNDISMLKAMLNTDQARLYLKQKASMDRTPLYFACEHDRVEMVEFLLAFECVDCEECDVDGWTPLFVALMKGHMDVVYLMLEAGAKFNVVESRYGWTLLFLATWRGDYELVSWLVENGADIEMVDKNRRSPMWIASMKGFVEIIDLFIVNGANVDSVDSDLRSPLYIAVQFNKIKVVEMLINSGCEVDLADSSGRTPLFIAYKLGHSQTEELIKKGGADQSSVISEYHHEREAIRSLNCCQGKLVKKIDTKPNKVQCVIKHEGRIWGGCHDGTILIWDQDGNLLLKHERAQKQYIHQMISVDDQVWAISENESVYVWSIKIAENATAIETEDIQLITVLKVSPHEVNCLIRVGDKIWAGSDNGKVLIWDKNTFDCDIIQIIDTENDSINRLEGYISFMCHHDKYFFISTKCIIYFFESKKGNYKMVHKFDAHTDLITNLVYSDEKLYSSSRDGNVFMWDLNKGERTSLMPETFDSALSIVLLKDQLIVSFASGNIISIEDNKKQSLFPDNHKRDVTGLCWNEDNERLWAVCLDRTLSIWQ